MSEVENGVGVTFTVKELLGQQDKKLDSILQAVTNTITGVDALRERVVLTEAQEKRTKDDLLDLKQTLYLAEQRRLEEMRVVEKSVDNLASSKEVADALKQQDVVSKSNRRYLIFALIASGTAIIGAVVAIVALMGH